MFPGRARHLGLAVLALVAFYLAYSGLAVVLNAAQNRVVDVQSAWSMAGRGLLALSVAPLVAALVLYGVLIRFGGWSPDRLRIPPAAQSARRLAEGLVWGAGMAGAALGLAVLGGARLMTDPGPESYVSVAAPAAVGLACAALLEELLFRGFPLARLAQVAGPVLASAVLALLFVLAHAANPVVSGLGLVNIGLASLLLSAVFFSAGGLPAAVGLHFGWNAGLALAVDAPVSGLQFDLPALDYAAGSRTWWTGGSFGPEGGLATALLFGGALAWWWRRGFSQQGVGR